MPPLILPTLRNKIYQSPLRHIPCITLPLLLKKIPKFFWTISRTPRGSCPHFRIPLLPLHILNFFPTFRPFVSLPSSRELGLLMITEPPDDRGSKSMSGYTWSYTTDGYSCQQRSLRFYSAEPERESWVIGHIPSSLQATDSKVPKRKLYKQEEKSSSRTCSKQ